MAVRRLSHASISSLAVVLIAVLTTGLCVGWVYGQYVDVRRQSADIQTKVFRDTVALFRDLWQLEHVMERVIEAGIATDEDVFEFGQRIDFLYVRTEELIFGAGQIESADVEVREVVQGLKQVIAVGDSAIQNELQNPVEFFQATRPILTDVSREAMELFDRQYVQQSKAITGQIWIIQKLTFSAIALLCLFGSVAAGMSFLFQRQLQIQAKRQEAEAKANFLAFYDGLTGLPNRVKFKDFAEKLLRQNDEPIVFLFDLDDFKLVNDLHGHSAGDAVLLHCADKIRDWAQEFGGIPARLGGDEFAAILPGPMSSMKIAAICEQLLAATSAELEYGSVLLAPKMSIGVAAAWSLETEDELELSFLQKAADVALYRAKDQGKNTYAFFDGDLAEMAARRREIEIGISKALEDDAFTLAFQPQVEMITGRVRGFEALARWQKDGVSISPGEFIPVAEATGQVVDIDLWGLRKSTAQVAQWIEEGKFPVSISTNLSPLHFRNDDIVDQVARALADSRLPPHLLTLEITESVLIEDLTKVTVILEKLRQLGVRIALDDFGTGYSSLAYLRRLDVDYIKIDQSFVRDLEDSTETQLILDALVDIAKGLNKMLVVEGIETETQAHIIRKLGCDMGQGYLWGRPMPAEVAVDHVPAVEALFDQVEMA